ncbi:MAG: hypothetical protein FWF79_10670 [Defluviitaleaceae bacterium]|nr:hypothetical protein [Defluviitaleaceae bacterium]
MKRDHDEIKIQELFGKINTPQYDILRGVKIVNRENKRKRPRFSAILVTTVVLMVLTAGAVLAYYGGGGFQRLRGIVGDEYADMLTPVEAELGAAEDGFASPFIPGYKQTHDDMRIEVVAINLCETGDYMDIYITIECLTGERLNCEFNRLTYVLHTHENAHLQAHDISLTDWDALERLMYSFSSGDIIHRCENGILTLHTRHPIGRDDVISDGEVTITFLEIMYNSTDYINDVPIPLDLNALPENPAHRRISFDEQPTGAVLPFCPINEDYFSYVLEPFQLNIPVGAPGINARISSAGFINGNLHVQLYQPRPTYSAFSALHLRNPGAATQTDFDPNNPEELMRARQEHIAAFSGAEATVLHSLIFNLLPDGTATQDFFYRESKFPITAGNFNNNQMQEFIWANREPGDNLNLTGTFYNHDAIWLDWTTTFSTY